MREVSTDTPAPLDHFAVPLAAPTSLLLVCSVCLLDDAMFLVVVAAALVVALLVPGASRLMAVAERLAWRDRA